MDPRVFVKSGNGTGKSQMAAEVMDQHAEAPSREELDRSWEMEREVLIPRLAQEAGVSTEQVRRAIDEQQGRKPMPAMNRADRRAQAKAEKRAARR